MTTVTIFGSGKRRPESRLHASTVQLGRLLAQEGYAICNGGYGGTMEAAAQGAAAVGGRIIGVLMDAFSSQPNKFNTESIVAENLLLRIDALIRRGDAFIVLAGGTGTLAEIGILLEFMNKGFIPIKPIAFIGDKWRPLIEALLDERLLAMPPRVPGCPFPVHGPVALVSTAEEAVDYIKKAIEGGHD